MRPLPILIALAIAAGEAVAQTPPPAPPPPAPPQASISGPDSAVVGSPIYLDVSATVSASPADVVQASGPYPASLAPSFDKTGTNPTFVKLTFSDPGTYSFAVIAYATSGKASSFSFKTVTVLAATPPPVPAPPPPAKAPFAGELFVTLIYDATDPTAGSSIASDVQALDAHWFAAASVSPIGKLFATHLASDGLPVVYATDAAGKLQSKLLKPASKADVLGFVQSIRKGGN